MGRHLHRGDPRSDLKTVTARLGQAPAVAERLLRVAEAAERLAYSRTVVQELIRSGRLRAVRISQHADWRVPDDAIAEFIASLPDNGPE